MSPWNVAAAQYTPGRQGIDAHVQHHLRFIDAAARQQCHLLVFPELSLTGPANESGLLVAPPSEHDLAPVVRAVHTHNVTVIAGVTLNSEGIRQKGVALFSPKMARPVCYQQGSGAYLSANAPHLLIVENKAELPPVDPLAALFTSSQAIGETRCRDSINRLQRFAHKYAIAVLMANAHGNSALWDASGQLIVRADKGELLLTGSWGKQGWQGDIIPLR